MNIQAFTNTTCDYAQYTTAATKAGFRFINAYAGSPMTFCGTLPAVDAPP
jgi:hypothetical protein